MEKGRIEFDDPNYRPATLDEKREQVRKGAPDLVRYRNANRPASPPATEKCERCGYHDASKCEPDCPYELEPADRAAKCPVCPKCLSDVCDCQFAAAEKCEKCGGDGKQRDSFGRIGDCECKTCEGSGYRPPAPEPAERELTDDLYSLPPREFGQKLAEEAIKKLEKLGPPDENPAPVDATEDARAWVRQSGRFDLNNPLLEADIQDLAKFAEQCAAKILESERPEIERKAVERFIITQMRNNQY